MSKDEKEAPKAKAYGKTTYIILITIFLLPVLFWGMAYEFSYFYVLGIDVSNVFTGLFTPFYYLYTPLSYILTLLIGMVVVTNISKFFSKNIQRDEWKNAVEQLEQLDINASILQAKTASTICFIYWVYVLLALHFGWSTRVGTVFLTMIFYCIGFFIAGFYKSNIHGRVPLILAFIISVGFCFSAGGIAIASMDKKNLGIIRSDMVVIVKSDGKSYTANANQITPEIRAIIKALSPIKLP
ncbi:hypothetical protein [Aquirhabdus parva]|uniref:Uncharacterized protein n=1 Tax=Aquirhabdus parva TaxID=2283318 RepID=A0A345P7L3_9GAMM|nr:hypothetical protein [Aquirhabdus parva]AXI03272.1 hypothetical protein HYN46_10730 [Aquirhabdus parva]